MCTSRSRGRGRVLLLAPALALAPVLVAPRAWLHAVDCQSAFRRGDTNGDGLADLSDAIGTLGFLFLGASPPPCEKAADSNDSGDLDLSDPIHVLGFLFSGGAAPPAPGPFECGVDATADNLTCESGAPCEEQCPCEEGEAIPCGSSNVGNCRMGVRRCTGGAFGPCEDAVEPAPELCDLTDNDCDGVTDNGFEALGQPCDGPDADLCANGTLTCSVDATALECIEEGSSIEEVCDEVDNDCDLDVDEGFDEDGDGVTTCAGDCDDADPTVNPEVELDRLDGKDNDCDLEVDEGPFETSHARDIQPIWTASCASSLCHDATNPASGQNLTAGAAYGNIVNVPSQDVPTLDRIEPGDPDRSYLYHKVQGTQRNVGGSGNRMPSGGNALPLSTRNLIRQWILEGAPP